MKSFKKVLIIIILILTVGLISGALVLAKNQKKEEIEEVSTQSLESTNEIEIEDKKEDQEIIVSIEQQEETEKY